MSDHDKEVVRHIIRRDAYGLARQYAPDMKVYLTGKELRIGSKGSKAFDLHNGLFYDHETTKGGDEFDFMKWLTGWSFKQIIEHFLGKKASTPIIRPKQSSHSRTNDNLRYAMDILHATTGIDDKQCIVKTYLANRGLHPDPFPPDIRFHSALKHPKTQQYHPCMVAIFNDVNGAIQGIHRTYITESGYKLSSDGINPKLMLGKSEECAVRLSPVYQTLGIAEGIETALSVTALTNVPCWAAGSASNIQNIKLPSEVQHVHIYLDNDSACEEAARIASLRLTSEGRTVQLFRPLHCADFNDELQFLIKNGDATNIAKGNKSYD